MTEAGERPSIRRGWSTRQRARRARAENARCGVRRSGPHGKRLGDDRCLWNELDRFLDTLVAANDGERHRLAATLDNKLAAVSNPGNRNTVDCGEHVTDQWVGIERRRPIDNQTHYDTLIRLEFL